MKKLRFAKVCSCLICLSLLLSLFGWPGVHAADEIWTEEPTRWLDESHVFYQTADGHLCNWGVRGETARFLSSMAKDYYTDLDQGCYPGDGCEGGSGQNDAADSELYAYLRVLLKEKQDKTPAAEEAKASLRYTDCMVSDCDAVSSFFSGVKLAASEDGWQPECIWPEDKADAGLRGDLMAFRSVRTGEAADRGAKPYGMGEGCFDPGADVRGDVARILLYCYTRWDSAEKMFGSDGVIESADVLLDWMAEDPVDLWEMGRNDAVEAITGVRNCYVDFPHLAWRLFGKDCPDIPTPRNRGYGWPPDTIYAVEYTAAPDDPAHGTVEVNGLAATVQSAEGYYASGYDVIEGRTLAPVGTYDPSDLVWWDHGRLLCTFGEDVRCDVRIHFTPIGETDPCPTGHSLDKEHPVSVREATCAQAGEEILTCTRCGKNCAIPLSKLEHEPDGGTVTREPTVDQAGVRTYVCKICGETVWEEPILFTFDDVTYENVRYYTDAVYLAVQMGITKGTDATHFTPNGTCTRGEIVTFLWREAGKPEPERRETPFTDVKSGAYYAKAVAWAVEHGITKGMDATHFDPGGPCTRAQIVTFLWRSVGAPKPAAAGAFTDVAKNAYYANAVSWAVEKDITNGTTDTTFTPDKTCTRAEAVTFIARKIWNN